MNWQNPVDKKTTAIVVLSVVLGVVLIVVMVKYISDRQEKEAETKAELQKALADLQAKYPPPATSKPPDTPPPRQEPTLEAAPAHRQMPTKNEDGTQRQGQTPAGVYDWVQVKQEQFVLDSGAGRSYGPITGVPVIGTNTQTVRYDIKSSQAVNTGVMHVVEGATFTRDQLFDLFDRLGLKMAACYQVKTLEADQTCAISTKKKQSRTIS